MWIVEREEGGERPSCGLGPPQEGSGWFSVKWGSRPGGGVQSPLETAVPWAPGSQGAVT